MRRRALGDSGIEVSAIGLGCWGCPAHTARPMRPKYQGNILIQISRLANLGKYLAG